MLLVISKEMRQWSFQLLRFIGLWFFYVGVFSVILLIGFAVVNIDVKTRLDSLDTNFLVVFQIPILIGTILLGKATNNSLSLKDFRIPQILQGLIIGFLLMFVFVVIQLVLGSTNFSWNGFHLEIGICLFLFILVAINEELLFRHLFFSHLCKRFNIKYSIIICSLIFSLIHLGNDNFNWVGFVTIFLFGVLMSLFYIKYNNLSVPIASHFAWNFFQGPVFGYPVSGLQVKSIFSADIAGHNFYLNGGNFGAEGSILVVLIIIIFIYMISKHAGFSDIRYTSANTSISLVPKKTNVGARL